MHLTLMFQSADHHKCRMVRSTV